MASDVVYDAIRGYLDPNKGGTWTETPIAWENEDFTKPEPPVRWVMVEISGTVYGQQSIGADEQRDNRWDEEGTLWLHVFEEVGKGSSAARRVAKALADKFRGARLLSDESLEFGDAAIGSGERSDDDGNWWRVSVSIDWRRMEA